MVELSRPRLVRVRPAPPPGSHVGEPRYCSYRRCAPRCGTLQGTERFVGPCSIDYGLQLLLYPGLAARALDALHMGWQLGSASCRARVGQVGSMWVGDGYLEKQQNKET